MKSLLIIIPVFISSCVVSRDPYMHEARRLQKGRITEDTSFVYQLPFEKGASYTLVQGYYSGFSHKHRAALDFKMKRGTKICAVRDGVVIRVKEDSDRGGLNKKYLPFANNVVIQHSDGSRSGYWHLQKDGVLVNVGDTVKVGQVIALSGKTGYAAIPHLHFLAWNPAGGRWRQVPTRFQTSKGIRYLRPIRKYKNK